MKVLFQVRNNAFTQRGGDTVSIERISANLRNLGVTVEVDAGFTKSPAEFDCVFLLNFTLPVLLRQQAERARQAQTPYVVLALNEDIPGFHAQSHQAAYHLINYVRNSQPHSQLMRNFPDVWKTEPVSRFDNEWVARNAALVFATGETEARVLKQYYPGLENIRTVQLGFDQMALGNADDFEREFGVKDYILSVGRIESRKNQLMLLKALENEETPLVLASGGFTYQPDYDQAVRAFKRRGQTLVLGSLSQTQLRNAYAACKIHALPSWYELPGLVSMEAASIGKNVVVSDMGTSRDYFEDFAFYCDPGNPDSVRNACLAAWNAAPSRAAQNHINSFTWENTAREVLKYMETIVKSESRVNLATTDPQHKLSFQQIVQEAENIARNGDFDTALEFVRGHKSSNSGSSVLWRAEGMLLIALQKYAEAEQTLKTAMSLDPKDSKIVCGLGICARQKGDNNSAQQLLARSLELDKFNKIAILQLMGVAYELNSFNLLESALKDYLAVNSSEVEFAYALAGCLYKQSKLEEAEHCCSQILSQQGSHKGASELKDIIVKEKADKLTACSVKTASAGRVEGMNQEKPLVDSAIYQKIADITELKRKHKISDGLREVAELLGDLAINSPVLEEVYCLQGELLALNGQLFESERRFNAVLVQYPSSHKAYCGLGAIYGEKADWVKAEDYFRKAISINAHNDVAYAGLAMSSLSRSDKEAAWHYYEKSLEVNPENLRAIFGIMELGYPQGKFTDIERVLKNYLDCHPANLELLYSLAGCLFAQNRFDEARQEVDKILILEPGHQRAEELKGVIDQKASRT